MTAHRVLKGGSVNYGTRGLRTIVRNWGVTEDRFWNFGFRIVVKRVKTQK